LKDCKLRQKPDFDRVNSLKLKRPRNNLGIKAG